MEIAFFPEDAGFASMIEAMKHSPRAYALFDVARLILNKPERHVVRLAQKPAADGTRAPMFLVHASESPFLNQDEAVRHLFRRHADLICKANKKPIDAPKGNFAFVNRCGVTGVVLGPPNYHGYQTNLVRHHKQRLPHMPFDQFKSRIQTVRDPETVKAWVEQMSFASEYECVACAAPSAPPATEPAPLTPTPVANATQPAEPTAAEPAAATPQPTEPAPSPSTDAPAAPPAPAAPARTFKSRDELEKHFIESHLADFITSAPEVRVSGQASRKIEQGAIQEAVRLTWESERRYPINTANGIRGRLRKEGFHFLKDRKGITYISIVKTKRFESLAGLREQAQQLVTFLRANEGCNRKQMLAKILAPTVAGGAAVPGTEPASPAPGTGAATTETLAPAVDPDRKAKEDSLLADLHWLIIEGYVVEFSDGRLWALEDRPPPPPPAPTVAQAAPTSNVTPAPITAKLGVIHYNFPGFSFADFLKFAAETGYGYIELQLPDVWGSGVAGPEQNADHVRRQVEAYGLKVSALAAHNDFVQLDDETVRSQVERMKRVCGLAKILGTSVIRTEGGQPKDAVPQEKWLEAMYGCFARCVPFLEEFQIGLAIDNHGLVTNDGGLLFALLQKVGHRLVGTNLDTMNYRWFGHDIATCDRFYAMMAPHTLHTHLKDGFGSRAEYKGTALGEGEIHLQHALDCLRQAGYQGVYCAEYEGPEAEGGVGYRKCFDWMRTHLGPLPAS